MKFHLLLLLLPLMWCACKSRTAQPSAMNAAFEREKTAAGGESDLEDIRRSGELIVATISGPETYYDYRGAGMGLQYALADHFAHSEGLKVRMELAKDTTELLEEKKRKARVISATLKTL